MIYTPALKTYEDAMKHYNKLHAALWDALLDADHLKIAHYGTTMSRLADAIVKLSGRMSVQKPEMTVARLAGLDAQG